MGIENDVNRPGSGTVMVPHWENMEDNDTRIVPSYQHNNKFSSLETKTESYPMLLT
jgi:hypothetical protein